MLKKLFVSAILCTASMVAMAQSQIITHVVQRGETLESIAKFYNISVALNNANPNADGLIYVGMKLAVPVMNTAATTTTTTTATTPTTEFITLNNSETAPTVTQSYTDTPRTESRSNSYHNTWQRNQTLLTYGLTFFSADFGYVKESGHYGIYLEALNLYNSLFGFSLTLGSFNFGLVDSDSTSDAILWGPNIAYEVVKGLRVAIPIQVMNNITFEEKNDKSKTYWGWAISPRLYYSFGKVTINAGILLCGGFKSGEDVTCGFTVGIGL